VFAFDKYLLKSCQAGAFWPEHPLCWYCNFKHKV